MDLGLEGLYPPMLLSGIGTGLYYKDRNVLYLPVFPSASGSILKAATIGGALRELGIRSGCPEPPTLYNFRAEGLINIGKQLREINTGKLFRHLELVPLKPGSPDIDVKEEGTPLNKFKDVYPRLNTKLRRSLKSLETDRLRAY
ncbi:hypothetical protein PG996_012088 [Apiospora saccharicola]|uniref:Uncharacterized protein n=1 Tax=Apiospora saccharicola TaxID=335842 RepID=A0ABR1U1M2_9PEZI